MSSLSHDRTTYPLLSMHHQGCSAHVGTKWLPMSEHGKPNGQHAHCWLGWWQAQYLRQTPRLTACKTSVIAILSNTSPGTRRQMAATRAATSGQIVRPFPAGRGSPVQRSQRATGKECPAAIATRPSSTGCWGAASPPRSQNPMPMPGLCH